MVLCGVVEVGGGGDMCYASDSRIVWHGCGNDDDVGGML